MKESERSDHCRKRALYTELLAPWRRPCEDVRDWAEQRGAQQIRAE